MILLQIHIIKFETYACAERAKSTCTYGVASQVFELVILLYPIIEL